MRCPYCNNPKTRAVDTRESGEYAIRRRRECVKCGKRFTTYEYMETTPVYVIKKEGRREKFDKNKLKNGIMKALEKRPVEFEKIEQMINDIDEKIKQIGGREVKSSDIGEIVIDSLKKLDEVAYIRFASVYRSFADVTSFENELRRLLMDKRRMME